MKGYVVCGMCEIYIVLYKAQKWKKKEWRRVGGGVGGGSSGPSLGNATVHAYAQERQ